ncbi:FecR family protein [Wenyingzhuangia sp. IMCC45533]
MERLIKIFETAGKVLKSILVQGYLDEKEIEKNFSQKNTTEILERLQSDSEQNQRVVLISYLDNGKKEDFKKIKREINPPKNTYYLKGFYKVAAIFIIGFGSYHLYHSLNESQQSSPIALIDTENIILKMENGESRIISLNSQQEIIDPKIGIIKSKEGKVLDYQSKHKSALQTLVYNELTIPYGKTFEIVLSDKTKVYLNSGSSIKYPIKFIEGKNREVFLTGEAYFKVSKDRKHPFIVNTNGLNIRVLGTEFNVSSYAEDKNIFTVLVEGSVSLYGSDKSYEESNATLLEPGKKARWNKFTKKMKTKRVDTNIYTSWIDGKLVLEELKFSTIVKKLERHYNVKIINRNTKLASQRFTATFKTETIEEVLASFKINYPFNYSKEHKTITIN